MKTVLNSLLITGLIALLSMLPGAFAQGLTVGEKAPNFNLIAAVGSDGQQQVQLADYQGKNVVLVFYPMDNTPGCTIQLCSLRDDYEKFEAANTAILAANPASLSSHQGFAKKQNYQFPILVDSDKTMAKAYGVNGAMGFNKRTVYLIDPKGIIQWVHSGIQDNETLLAKIKSLNNTGN